MDSDPFADIPPQYTIIIDPPVEFDGKRYDQMVLREPKAGEVRKADEQLRNGTTMSAIRVRESYLISFVSGIPQPAVERIPISRITLAMEYLGRFLAGIPTESGSA